MNYHLWPKNHQALYDAENLVIAPVEELVKGKPQLEWEAVQISPVAPNLAQAIKDKLREEEWLIDHWSPIHLRNLLKQWYWKEVNALKVWQDTCCYLYLPRLLNEQVFQQAIAKGIETKDYFAFAAGKEGDRYIDFVFGQAKTIELNESSLLIEREAALAWCERMENKKPRRQIQDTIFISTLESISFSDTIKRANRSLPKHFYGTIHLDPIKAKMDFATLMDEVVQQFTAQHDVEVKISVEIQARRQKGFDESIQRIIKENCNVLQFNSAEFEQGNE